MSLWPQWVRSSWPFVLVLTIASVAAFATWLTVGLSINEPVPRLAVAALVFVAVGATLIHYVFSCLRRHRREAQRRPPVPGSN